MFSPPEILNTLLFIFCSLFLFSECSILNDPKSTIICIPGDTMYNVTLSHGINAGVFTAIHSAKTMPQCIRESCNRRSGEIAFLIEDSCFMVSCFRKDYCQTVPSKARPNSLRVMVTPYTFFDAAPVFQTLPRTLYVAENNDVGKSLLDIFAYAKSRREDNATIFFNITSGNTGNAFKLVEHPEIGRASLVANVVLDRENISYYYLVIQATNVDEQKVKTVTLRVEVLDSNDNAPKFPRAQYRTTINSNVSIGTEVFRVNAIDSDTGENAQIRYYLMTFTQFFQILPETGHILVKQRLRIDRTQTYTLIVAAINGKHRAVASVNIKVVALNEFRPFFQRLNYQVRVSEAVKVGTSLVRIFATDNDAGSFSKLRYSIIRGNKNLFRIDNNGDVKTKRPLINLGVKNFTLSISVRDSGNPPMVALETAKLVVLVTEMKRHKVKFDVPLYTVRVMENIPVGYSILNVRAVSGLSSELLESARGQNKRGRIVYTIENKDDAPFFRISKRTGAISTKRPIDYEENKEFRLTVIAKDIEARKRGLRVQKDHAIVRIKVIDLNDNRPQFVLSSYQEVINENTTIDSSILRVTANDADNGMNKRVEYIMQYGNINDTFSLDPDTGTLRLSRSLAEGTIEFFNLTVYARDMGRPPLSSKPVSIYLKIKRHTFGPTRRPIFPVPIYLATVNESCAIGTEILRVRARMPSGENNGIKYYATQVSGGADMHFAVNTVTGSITLIRKLDYNKRDRFVFLVAAIDVSKASSVDNVLVRILVEDVNDHKPKFNKPFYNVVYDREPPLFSRVVQVTATDDDAGKNAELSYSLYGNTKDEKGYFEIEPRTGSIKITRMLQQESLSLFRMSVSVTDNGTPPLAGDKKSQVNVLIFQPFSTPMILIKTTEQTITVQFNLKYLDVTNVEKFAVIVQEYVPSEDLFEDYTKLKPLTWFLVNFIQKENQHLRRYVSKMIPNTPDITKFGMFQTTVGDGQGCDDKKKARKFCSGPLKPSSKYRFQLRAFLKDRGPFDKHKFKDGDFTDAFFTGLSKAAKTYRKEGRRNYDAVVYSVAAALVLVIVLAFLRGFYRLKLDRIRIHEDKKKQISFPVSNPRFQDPESPVEKIKTPGQGRRLMASINAEKVLDIGRSEEDDGSSPDSALDESTRPLQRQRPKLQDIRLKSYFHSVDTESCNSCDGVRVYYVQESTA